jgi:hypothetical protein
VNPAHPDPEAARLAALTALRGWALRRDRLPGDRARLLAAAWQAGARNIRELARLADVSRETVYADLRSSGIDPRDRSGQPSRRPRYEPLRHDEVRDLAEMATSVLVNAMLTEEPGTLASAAWQAQIALTRVAELLDPAPGDGFDRAGAVEDLAARGDYIRQSAHRLLAAEHSADVLAERTEQHRALLVTEQAQVLSARLRLLLPYDDGVTIDVELNATDDAPGRPREWTSWRSDSLLLAAEVDGEAHLEIAAAMDSIGAVLTTRLREEHSDGA